MRDLLTTRTDRSRRIARWIRASICHGSPSQHPSIPPRSSRSCSEDVTMFLFLNINKATARKLESVEMKVIVLKERGEK